MGIIVKWFAKKYAVSLVNDAIKAIQDKVDIDIWISRINKVIAYLQSILKKLEDKKITADEADAIIDETKELFK